MSTFRSHQGKTVIRMDILPPEPATRAARTGRGGGEVVDAQFVTVGNAARARMRPQSHNDNRRQTGAPDLPASMPERLLHRCESFLRGLSADAFSAAVALVFVTVFGMAGGFSFLFSGSETVEAPKPLDITHVTMTPQDANGMRVLLINGIIENRSSASMTMPSIRAELMSGEKVVTSTLISPPAFAIAAGRSRGFSARVPHPGGKLPDLRLSLTERGA